MCPVRPTHRFLSSFKPLTFRFLFLRVDLGHRVTPAGLAYCCRPGHASEFIHAAAIIARQHRVHDARGARGCFPGAGEHTLPEHVVHHRLNQWLLHMVRFGPGQHLDTTGVFQP